MRLEVYDPLGRLVRELTPKGWMEAGEQTVVLNGEGLSSGAYWIYVEAGNEVVRRTVNLIK